MSYIRKLYKCKHLVILLVHSRSMLRKFIYFILMILILITLSPANRKYPNIYVFKNINYIINKTTILFLYYLYYIIVSKKLGIIIN